MSKLFTIAEGLENMGAIKTGGQGSVYKGRRIGEIITAIKLLPTPILSTTEEDKHYRDFTNEVKKLQRVNEEPNANIVKILSYGVTDTGSFPYIEMEYIDGPDLGELLKPPHDPVFTVKELARVAYHLSHALAHCHGLDVKHGDIKSNNVKYNRHTGNYVLIDFGLAIHSDEERRSSMRQAGAIEFMAPEQNEGKLLFQSDVYSFGIVLYELLAGQVPFPLDGNSETARNKVMVAHLEVDPPNPLPLRAAALPAHWAEEKKQAESQVPEWLLTMLDKCLQKDPAKRFASGVELNEYITHHRLYNTPAAGLATQESEQWQAKLNEKEAELAALRIALRRAESDRVAVPAPVPAAGIQRGVSRGAFNAALVAAVLLAGLSVYALFFNKPVVSGASTLSAQPISDTAADLSIQQPSATTTERAARSGERRRQVALDSMRRVAVQDRPSAPQTDSTDEEAAARRLAESNAAERGGEEQPAETGAATGGRYKVRNKAYFHDAPDPGTRRKAFIVHWNNAVLKPLDEQDGFVYVVFTNHLGQTSKGWLLKADLLPAN